MTWWSLADWMVGGVGMENNEPPSTVLPLMDDDGLWMI